MRSARHAQIHVPQVGKVLEPPNATKLGIDRRSPEDDLLVKVYICTDTNETENSLNETLNDPNFSNLAGPFER